MYMLSTFCACPEPCPPCSHWCSRCCGLCTCTQEEELMGAEGKVSVLRAELHRLMSLDGTASELY
eukprot:364414-Chlamydomonas_euryale.AAC.5